MNRAAATLVAATLALGGAACDSTVRPIEPTAQAVDDCSRCHGYPPPAFIAGGTTHTTSTQCSACHPGTVAPDNVTIVPGGLHMNGVVDVNGGVAHEMPYVARHPAAALASIASCTACHGADYGGDTGPSCNGCHAGIAASGPDWKTNCTFCHGTRTANVTTATAQAAPPQAVVVTADQTPANPKVGAHQAHLAAGAIAGALPCSSCHTPPTAAQALTHFTGGAAQIAFGALASLGVASPSYAGNGGSCAVYCHGATLVGGPAASPAWTSTASLGCASCHGNPPSSHAAGSTDCYACHPGTVNANNTSINVAGGLHIDGQKEATSAHPSGWNDFRQHGYSANASGLSSCKGCHGPTLTGSGSAPSCASCHGTGWDTNCTFCHGTPGGRTSPPVDTQGRSATSNVSVGTHDSHVASTMSNAFACTECHPARTTSVITDTAHLDGNGVAEVALGTLAKTGGAPAAYTRTSATAASCSSVYCHGKFTGGVNAGAGATMSWTSTTQVSCTSCHGLAPATGEHSRHSGGSFVCGECHGSGYTSSAVVKANHVNGVKNVPFSSSVTSPSPPPTWNGTSCTLTCHGKNHSNETW